MAWVWFVLENSNDFSFLNELWMFSDLIYLLKYSTVNIWLYKEKKVLKHRIVFHSTHEKFEMTKYFLPFFLDINTHLKNKHIYYFFFLNYYRKCTLIFFFLQNVVLFILCTRFVTVASVSLLNRNPKQMSIFIISCMFVHNHPSEFVI